jgi:hypothetical protein
MPFKQNERVIRVRGPPDFMRTTGNIAGEIMKITPESRTTVGSTMPRIYHVLFDNRYYQCCFEDQLRLESSVRVVPPVVPPRKYDDEDEDEDEFEEEYEEEDDDIPKPIKVENIYTIDGDRPATIIRKRGDLYDIRYEDNSEIEYGVDISRITKGLRMRKPKTKTTVIPISASSHSRGPRPGQSVKYADQRGVIEKINGNRVIIKFDKTGISRSFELDDRYLTLL